MYFIVLLLADRGNIVQYNIGLTANLFIHLSRTFYYLS